MAEVPNIPKPGVGSAYLTLRRRLRRFVEAYVETGNASEAMRRIGFKGRRPDVAGCKLLRKPKVRAAVDEYEALVIGESRQRVYRSVHKMELIESFDPRKLVDEEGRYLPLDQLPAGAAAAITGIDVEMLHAGRGENRRCVGQVVKYRFVNPIDASKLLLQWKKQLSDRHELTGKDGEPLPAGPIIIIQKDEAKQIGQELDQMV